MCVKRGGAGGERIGIGWQGLRIEAVKEHGSLTSMPFKEIMTDRPTNRPSTDRQKVSESSYSSGNKKGDLIY